MPNFSISSTIKENPEASFKKGDKLTFDYPLFPHLNEASFGEILDWGYFKGTLLNIHISKSDKHSLEGCGVMVAPGVVLTAKHVIDSHIEDLQSGETTLVCIALKHNELQFWQVNMVSFVPDSDLAIMGLICASDMPSDSIFNFVNITTKIPKIGDRLLIVGFKSGFIDYPLGENIPIEIQGNLFASFGCVTQRFVNGRDKHMLPFPVIEVECTTLAGMSGGAVFNSDGLLIGLLATSLGNDAPISYVSLLFPALISPYEGGWPKDFFRIGMLIDMEYCSIDDRSVFEVNGVGENGIRNFSFRYEK